MSGTLFNPSDIGRLLATCDHVAGEGVLYVLEFDTDLVKVGRTSRPRARLSSLTADAHRFSGARLVRGWISIPHEDYVTNEYLLLKYATKSSIDVRKAEYFLGADFSDLVDFAQRLSSARVPNRRRAKVVDRPDPNSPERTEALRKWIESIRL